MAFGKIYTNTLSGIANAIRSQNGEETAYKPGEMADAILSLESAATKSIVVYLNYDGTYLSAAVIEKGETVTDPVENGALEAPTREADEDGTTYTFSGWDSLPADVSEDVVIVTATYTSDVTLDFEAEVVDGVIANTWEEIVALCDSGNYSAFSVGDTKELELGDLGTATMAIVAIDADNYADGSGTVPLTWVSTELITTMAMMAAYAEGGWANSDIREYLRTDVWDTLPEALQTGIKTVTKSHYVAETGGTYDFAESEETVWIPAWYTELADETCLYYEVFNTAKKLIKYTFDETATTWWTRDAAITATSSNRYKQFTYVSAAGARGSAWATSTVPGVALGFCT